MIVDNTTAADIALAVSAIKCVERLSLMQSLESTSISPATLHKAGPCATAHKRSNSGRPAN
jgi:hypothetical protein